MEGFVKVNDTLINTKRLMTVQRRPPEGRIAEHYLAVFDTGQKLMLSLEDGVALVEHYQSLNLRKPPTGSMATTSEREVLLAGHLRRLLIRAAQSRPRAAATHPPNSHSDHCTTHDNIALPVNAGESPPN